MALIHRHANGRPCPGPERCTALRRDADTTESNRVRSAMIAHGPTRGGYHGTVMAYGKGNTGGTGDVHYTRSWGRDRRVSLVGGGRSSKTRV